MEASSVAGSPPETPEDRGRSLRTAAMITAGIGAAHAILFLVSWLLRTARRIDPEVRLPPVRHGPLLVRQTAIRDLER